MNIIEMAHLRPASGGAARFEGADHDATVSFFVVKSAPGQGADKHRHPYEEIFVVLDGHIEIIIDGKLGFLDSGQIAVIPPNTWHEFKNRASDRAQMVNIHPSPRIIQEDWADISAS